ncbi:proliferation marker protein Ki-67-like isoform X2 [Corticium candelabrum]|uniref:proliferation marker protein Ki-67-like isoform X2 n=1 Tax=Corticium candelabrum TaxID=121492 RepID=UPI002E25D55A|nr:proliferation marker protein Ki-67-like isoform X2 [Corticium candelabrum]
MSAVLCDLILIKRTGQDGTHYPVYLDTKECVFGRDHDCDVRIQISNVSRRHATLYAGEGKQPWIENLSSNKTLVNDVAVEKACRLYDGDIIKISDRCFRCELPNGEQPVAKQPSPPLVETQNVSVVTSEKIEASERVGKERLSKSPKLPTNENRNGALKADSKRAAPVPESGSFPGSISPRPIRARKRISNQSSVMTPRLLKGKSTCTCDQKYVLSPVEEETQSSHETQSFEIDVDACQGSSTATPGHRRSVHFGPMLSPEEFDNRLPPNTPVKVGRTPTGIRRSLPGIVDKLWNCQLKRCSLTVMPSNKENTSVKDGTQHSFTLPEGSGKEGELRQSIATCSSFSKETEAKKVNSDAGTGMSPMGQESESGVQLRQLRKKMATPLRKQIQSGTQLTQLRKKMATPLRQQIQSGTELRQLRKKMATPLRKHIQSGTQLTQLRKKMATPLRKQIQSGTQLTQLRKKMATPLRQQIQSGTELRQLRKKMATPLRKQIQSGTQLTQLRKKMATPLRQQIQSGTELRQLRKRMATPLRQQIRSGTELRKLRKKMATPLRQQIQSGTELRQLRKRMATPLRQQIRSGTELRKLRKKMATPLRQQIQSGTQLRQLRKKMATPLRQQIQSGTELRQLRKKMATPLRQQIQSGTELRQLRKKMATPLRKQIQSGTQLTQLRKKMATPLRQQIQSGTELRQLRKRMSTPLRQQIRSGTELRKLRKKMATPLRQQIQSGTQLRQPRKKMATPLRQQIQSGTQLRQLRKKMATPLRQQIQSGTQLRQLRMKMATPLRQQIQSGTELRQLRKKMATPLQKQIQQETDLRVTRKLMATPLRHAIENGIQLKQLRIKRITPSRIAQTKLATPIRKQLQKGVVLRRAVAKTTAPIQKVKMMDSLPIVDTIAGTEIVKTEARQLQAKKKAAIENRVKLTACRRMKSTKQCVVQQVFHFSAKPASASSNTCELVSPSPKRSRTVQPKEVMSTPKLDGLKRLMKTPKARLSVCSMTRDSVLVPEDLYEKNLFATPHLTRKSSTGSTLKTQNMLSGSQRKRLRGDKSSSSGHFGINQTVSPSQYVLKLAQQSSNLVGIANVIKSPVSQVSTYSNFEAMPQVNTEQMKNKSSPEPEQYYNTHLFDMKRVDEEETDMTGFTDLFKSPSPVSSIVAITSTTRSNRSRKRTACYKVTNTLPVKRSRNAVVREATNEHQMIIRTRSKTVKSKPIAIDLTDDTVEASTLQVSKTIKEQKMTTRSGLAFGSIDQTDELAYSGKPLKKTQIQKPVQQADDSPDQDRARITRSRSQLKNKVQVKQTALIPQQADDLRIHDDKATVTRSGRRMKKIDLERVAAAPEQVDESRSQEEAMATRSGRQLRKKQVDKVGPPLEQATGPDTQSGVRVSHCGRRVRQKAVKFDVDITSNTAPVLKTVTMTRSRTRSQAAIRLN